MSEVVKRLNYDTCPICNSKTQSMIDDEFDPIVDEEILTLIMWCKYCDNNYKSVLVPIKQYYDSDEVII